MKALLRGESTLTDRYQTTVPEMVRSILHLQKRDKIRYTIDSMGQVILSKAEPIKEDPVLEKFLLFLAKDMQEHPQLLNFISEELVSQVRSLTSGVEFDLDSPLTDEDE